MKSRPFVFVLQLGALAVLLLLLLPVLAIGAFFGRFALLAAVGVALVGALALYAFSPRFREWLALLGETEVHYKGMRLATDVAVAPTHTWARGDRNAFVVGSDDVAPTLLGPVSTVELPAIGRWFRRGEPIAHLRRANRSVALRAPISGTVVGRNEALHLHPELVNDQPFADGWMVRMQSDPKRDDPPWLRRGRRARAWFREETDRLVGTLLARTEHAAVLGDGGQLVGQLYRQIDDEAWQRLVWAFFEAREREATR